VGVEVEEGHIEFTNIEIIVKFRFFFFGSVGHVCFQLIQILL
jgi:hypothetical protein